MKKYYQSASLPSLIALICSVLFITAGIFLIIFLPEAFEWILFFIGLGIPAFLISAAVNIPVVCTPLVIDDEKIVFPITSIPNVLFRKNVVKFSDIESVEAILCKGDGIITTDSYFYKFILVNGVKFTENLRAKYGKKHEKEIVDFLYSKNVKIVYDSVVK